MPVSALVTSDGNILHLKLLQIAKAIAEVKHLHEQLLNQISIKYYQLGEVETSARLQNWLA